MTTRQLIGLFTSEYSNGTPSQDARMRPRRAYYAFQAAKNEVIAQAMRTKKALSLYNYTFLACVPIIKSSFRDCQCPIIKNCEIFRVNCKVVSSLGSELDSFIEVTNTSGTVKFSKTDWSRLAYLNHTKFKHPNLFYIRNGYIYIISQEKELKYVSIRLVADDPIAVLSQCACQEGNGNECLSPLDYELSIDTEYLPLIIRRAKEILYGIQPREDVTSNSRDTPPQESK